MADLPTPSGTWEWTTTGAVASTNLALGNQASILINHQQALKKLKDTLIGMTTTPCLLVGCSLGNQLGHAAPGTAAVDYNAPTGTWTAVTDLLTANATFNWAAAATAHTWFVLKFPGIGSGDAKFQLCFDLTGASANGLLWGVFASQTAGFTGGNSGARPTATDEFTIAAASATWHPDAGSVATETTRLNVGHTTDGQITSIWFWYNNVLSWFLRIEKPAAPNSTWVDPHVVLFTRTSGSTVDIYGAFQVASASGFCKLAGTASVITSISAPFVVGAAVTITAGYGTLANDVGGGLIVSRALPTLICNTVNTRGEQGYIRDLWWCSITAAAGDTAPNDTSRQFIVLPGASSKTLHTWDGTVVVKS